MVAWKQAARAELTNTATFSVGYGQALLDLVKAFDRIPHRLLVREAIDLGYPLWFIRLSLETYKLKRVIRVKKVASHQVQAHRGNPVGRVTATTKMKLAIRIILRAHQYSSHVNPPCFVDDLSAERTGLDEHVVQEL